MAEICTGNPEMCALFRVNVKSLMIESHKVYNVVLCNCAAVCAT